MTQPFLFLGALLGALAVALGAFGAHALKARLTPENLVTFETGVRYHFYHSFALLAAGLVQFLFPPAGAAVLAGWLFLTGIVLFSGSLYWLSLGGPRWLGPVTPLGGLALIAGWIALALAVA
ncbi:MAG: DUF423 domain-containing protein [Caldilineaceae bacterium]|nr:DUF423 domain-containing protein [Caldilineaceae bacterium]